jgi:Cell division protein SepF
VGRSFNDAQQTADRCKREVPVIIHLQNPDAALAKRLIDFGARYLEDEFFNQASAAFPTRAICRAAYPRGTVRL